MGKKVLIRCSNCSGTDFEKTSLGTILATHGGFNVNAYACQNCGHIELFDPDLDLYAQQKRAEYEEQKRKEELERRKKEESRKQRIKKLEKIIGNDDMTVRQVKEAKKELEALRRDGGVFPIGNSDGALPKGVTIIEED